MKRLTGILVVLAVLVPVQAFATSFISEAAWRTAVGNVFALETFDAIAAGSDVTNLPALGLHFDPLTDGTQPTVQAYANTGGVVKSGPNNLLNDRDFALPARGPFVMRPISATDLLFGVGLWNVGGDDTLRMSMYDANDVLMEQVISPASSGFFGIVNQLGAKKIVIDFVAGNGYAPVDDLQTAVRTTFDGNPNPVVPEPATFLLMGLGLAGVAAVRRMKRPA